MFGAILKVTNSSFKKGMVLCRSGYVKKVMKLLALVTQWFVLCGEKKLSTRIFTCAFLSTISHVFKSLCVCLGK